MKYTIDHGFIRDWVESFGGRPALRVGPVDPTEIKIDIDWQKVDDPDLQPIGWKDFLDWFEAEHLAFGYPEETNIDRRYHEFASRDDVEVAIPEPSLQEEDHMRSTNDPFLVKREWKYDKPHRD